MNAFLSKLLGWSSLFSPPADWASKNPGKTYPYEWMSDVFGPISIVMYIIMGVVGAAGAIYAIYLGFQLAKAEDQSKRDEAKKHLITVIIAVAITIVLVLFFNELLPLIVNAFFDNPVKP